MSYKYTKTEKVSALLILLVAFGVGLSQIPFSWYVDVTEYRVVEPVCVGDDIITFYSERDARWNMAGETRGQLVKYEVQKAVETTIQRMRPDDVDGWKLATEKEPATFDYESYRDTAEYDTKWSETFKEPGVYGANEWITIEPLPFIKLTKFNRAEDTKFNVIVCDQ